MTFEHLTDGEFEELTYDLLQALGFVNLDWRRGSAGQPSRKLMWTRWLAQPTLVATGDSPPSRYALRRGSLRLN